MTEKELELYHFGVRGMKWGVRKAIPAMSGAVRSTLSTPQDGGRAFKGRVRAFQRRSGLARSIGSRVIHGPLTGHMAYSAARANGDGMIKATAKQMIAGYIGHSIGKAVAMKVGGKITNTSPAFNRPGAILVAGSVGGSMAGNALLARYERGRYYRNKNMRQQQNVQRG